MKRLFLAKVIATAGLAVLGGVLSYGQTTRSELDADPCKTGGVYYAYPVTESHNTKAPKGYKPFYASHYGRHGSRYLISDNDYRNIAAILHDADSSGALTELGKDVMARLDSVMIEADGRGGDLSPLGVRQHKAIAARMYDSFPDIFNGDSEISARSTVAGRCILSMDAFCESLKEKNPALRITRESSNRYMPYLCHHTPESDAFKNGWMQEQYRKFEVAHTHPDRLVASIFSNPDFVNKHVNPHDFMWGMYWIASGMQNIETPISFYDIFTADELFDLWQCFNYRFYAGDGNWADNGGLMLDNAKPLLRNIIESADNAISAGTPSATLRFGHDGNLIPLAGLMRLEGCYESVSDPDDFYKAFADFKIAPMAGNIQMIFFRPSGKKNNGAEDILVKFMLNERETSVPVSTDIWPFYRWDDVRKYWLDNVIN